MGLGRAFFGFPPPGAGVFGEGKTGVPFYSFNRCAVYLSGGYSSPNRVFQSAGLALLRFRIPVSQPT
jgi:hypothetical protein